MNLWYVRGKKWKCEFFCCFWVEFGGILWQMLKWFDTTFNFISENHEKPSWRHQKLGKIEIIHSTLPTGCDIALLTKNRNFDWIFESEFQTLSVRFYRRFSSFWLFCCASLVWQEKCSFKWFLKSYQLSQKLSFSLQFLN